VARVFAQMLPVLFEDVEPFEASEDIEKGKRWSSMLATVLSECSYGIICLTRSNLNMPWILFEAGALSKLDTSHVAPFLLGLKPSEVKPPLADFQVTSYDEADVKRLIKSINASLDRPRADANLERSWRLWWPDFKAQIDALDAESNQDVHEPRRDVGVTNQEMLEEILGLVREQRRLLRSTETILPPEHLASVRSEDARRSLEIAYVAIRLLHRQLRVHQIKAPTMDLTRQVDLASFIRNRLRDFITDESLINMSEAQISNMARKIGQHDRAIRARSATPVLRHATIADAEEQAATEDANLGTAVTNPEG